MPRLTRYLIAAALCLISAISMAAPFRYASWSVDRLGAENRSRDYTAVAQVIRYFDFVALQDVATREAVVKLRNELNQISGTRWGALVSPPTGSQTGHAEVYAYIWRADRMSVVGSAALYPDKAQHFSFDPFSAVFMDRVDQSMFVVATAHVASGQPGSTAAIKALPTYWKWLKKSTRDLPVVFSGNFGLSPAHPAFDALTADAVPVITSGATVLADKTGYIYLHDHIWLGRKGLASMPLVGIFKFPEVFGLTNQEARAGLSSHVPVFAILDFATSD